MHRRIFGFLHIALALAACREPNEPPGVDSTQLASLEITPATSTVKYGQTAQFAATVRDMAGRIVAGRSVSWKSTNILALQIDDNGRAAPLVNNPASILVIASLDTLADTAQVDVVRATGPEEFSVWPDTNALLIGMTRTLAIRTVAAPLLIGDAYVITPTTAASMSSSDPGIAAVTTAGVVTAVGAGHATITATHTDGRVSKAEVFVIDRPPARFTSVTSEWGTLASDTRFLTAGCGINAVDSGLYCWGPFGALWNETVLPPGRVFMPLPSSYVSAFDRCEQQTRFFFRNWLERTRCSEIPVRFFAPTTYSALSGLACGLSPTGEATCWGHNTRGELGIGVGDTAIVHGPTTAATTERFQSITRYPVLSQTGFSFLPGGTCGIRSDGVALCWGGDFPPTPTAMQGNVRWRMIADAGQCGIAVDSTAYCWTGSGAPAPIGAGMKWTHIVVTGSPSVCALAPSGRVFCWDTNRLDPPVEVSGDPTLVFLGAEFIQAPFGRRACGLNAAGDVYCVARSASGGNAFSLQPRDLGGLKLKSFRGLCGVGVDDKTYCWTTATQATPKVLPGQ